MKKVLVLAAQEIYRRILENDHSVDFELVFQNLKYNTRNNTFDQNIEAFLESARHKLATENFDGILYTSDIGAFLASILCREYALPGPSLESAFAALHKYYTRELSTSGVAFSAHSLDSNSLPEFDFPFYIKAPCSAVGVLGFPIRNPEEFRSAISTARKELPKFQNVFAPIFEKYLPKNKFPLATEDIMLVESFHSGNQITIEGFVQNGQISTTVITDTHFFPDSNCIESFTMPSVLPPQIQTLLEKSAIRDIRNLGITNSFFNIEYWIQDEIATLIEVNCRAAFCFHHLYQATYEYDVFTAALKLSCGEVPNIPKQFRPQKYSGQYNLLTLETGNSSDIFSYDTPLPPHSTLFIPPNTDIEQFSQFGRVIAQLNLCGDSFEELQEKAIRYRRIYLQ